MQKSGFPKMHVSVLAAPATFPTKNLIPFHNWSVLDLFNITFIMLGSQWSSILTSFHAKWWDPMKDFSLWTVISPPQKKLKNTYIVQTAHIISMSAFAVLDDYWFCRMVGVMGKQIFTMVGHWERLLVFQTAPTTSWKAGELLCFQQAYLSKSAWIQFLLDKF